MYHCGAEDRDALHLLTSLREARRAHNRLRWVASLKARLTRRTIDRNNPVIFHENCINPRRFIQFSLL